MISDKTSEITSADNDCMNAFKIDTNHTFQKDRNNECAPDTGQWFFHHPKYQAFQASKGLQLLFVTAEAGGGKSTIARTFIDLLQMSNDRPLVAYFFFKDDDDQLRSYEDAISSMLYQLFVQERALVRYARDLYKRYGHGIRYQTKEMWKILLSIAAETQREVICVLDAVDECAPAGRRELVSDMVDKFKEGSQTTSTRLKFVVTSRPYQDENHPYENLLPSGIIRHLPGEYAKVQSDIKAVIRFKAEHLAMQYQLSQSTLAILIETISGQNLQTRSFLAVRMAFGLLGLHHLMHKGAGEDTIRTILADIPHSLSDQFDAMLNRSSDKEHARRLFCVILSSRKTLKIPEFKVLYALTRPYNNTAEPPESYDDLEMSTDDEKFKQLVRARCGLFITFVKSSVHLFHQTAREHLMANTDLASITQQVNVPTLTTSGLHAIRNRDRQPTWKGCITEADANIVFLTVCLDMFTFKIPRSWVLDVFDSLNAGNDFHDDMKALFKDRPLLQYTALNWYEHAMLGGTGALAILCTARYAAVLDISKPSFWVWFFILADYTCSSTTKPKSPISKVWEVYQKHRPYPSYGSILREACLGKLFDLDDKLRNLLNDPTIPLSEASYATKVPVWTAGDGYELIDKYHLAYGEYEHASFERAAQCIEQGQVERGKLLSANVPTPTMIWACISEGAPTALKSTLAIVKDIEWLYEVPEHTMYRRILWRGWSSYSRENLRKDREKGWTAICPPAFATLSKAMSKDGIVKVFSVLADWMVSSDHAKEWAQKLWDAGGFLEPSFCRRLVDAGASIDDKIWGGDRNALQVAAALWEHDAVDTLIELDADPTTQKSNRNTALQWFLCGPEHLFKDQPRHPPSDLRTTFANLGAREQQRRRKSRITSTIKVLYQAQSMQYPIDQADDSGKYPLMLAARNSSTAVKALIGAGARVDQRDRWGRTALMHFFCGDFAGRSPAVLKYLLDAGADSSASDASGHTVLQYWARQLFSMDLSSLYPGNNRFNESFNVLTNIGPLSELDVLIRALIPLEIPLSAAVRLGNTKLCWALLMAGANPNKHGLTTRNRLPENHGSEAMDLEDLSWKPLLIALKHKAYTTAAVLLAYGADVAFRTHSRKRTKYNKYRIKTCGTTALHLAAQGDSKSYGTRMSLSTGSYSSCSFRAVGNPEHKISKESPLTRRQELSIRAWEKTESHKRRFQAESSDSEYEIPKRTVHNDSTGDKLLPYDKVSEAMLSSINFGDPLFQIIIDDQQTSTLRQKALLEFLLKKRAPVNAQTREGITPLACVNGTNSELAHLLLQYGADPNIASDDGCTPLMRAAQRGDRELVEVLLNFGASPDLQLKVAPPEKCQCSSFIERSAFTSNHCDAPLTALTVAAEHGHYDIMELLLKHGADPNLPITHHAHGRLQSKQDRRYIARLSEENDSSDSEAEPEQWKGYISVGTALSWARDEVRELLLRNGADPNKEEPSRECDCTVIEKRKERGWNESDNEWPTRSESEGSDAELRRHKYSRGLSKWDGDTDVE